ncbi:MAG: hypothetical protein QG577_83 [Thermodesulfobacteriota bacterium]|nr:hypothetical protein [Thermodesulfobacteriota bacterium]
MPNAMRHPGFLDSHFRGNDMKSEALPRLTLRLLRYARNDGPAHVVIPETFAGFEKNHSAIAVSCVITKLVYYA